MPAVPNGANLLAYDSDGEAMPAEVVGDAYRIEYADPTPEFDRVVWYLYGHLEAAAGSEFQVNTHLEVSVDGTTWTRTVALENSGTNANGTSPVYSPDLALPSYVRVVLTATGTALPQLVARVDGYCSESFRLRPA